MKSNYIILEAEGAETDFNNWNSIQNHYNYRAVKPIRPPSKKLIKSVIYEFEQWCKSYHIEFSYYKFVSPCQIEGEWRQFDFCDSQDKNASKISVWGIIAAQDGRIFQRCIETV